MVDAMDYEYLIRKAYHCDRDYELGADADIYRRYERKQSMYEENRDAEKNGKQRYWNQPIDEMAYDAARNAGEVATHIKQALVHVKNEYGRKMTEEQLEQLESYSTMLLEPSKKDIDEVIEKTSEIFNNLGLQAD